MLDYIVFTVTLCISIFLSNIFYLKQSLWFTILIQYIHALDEYLSDSTSIIKVGIKKGEQLINKSFFKKPWYCNEYISQIFNFLKFIVLIKTNKILLDFLYVGNAPALQP